MREQLHFVLNEHAILFYFICLKVFNETENKVKQGKERKKEEEAYSQVKMHLTRRKKFKRKD
jgi:hypothetical protein